MAGISAKCTNKGDYCAAAVDELYSPGSNPAIHIFVNESNEANSTDGNVEDGCHVVMSYRAFCQWTDEIHAKAKQIKRGEE